MESLWVWRLGLSYQFNLISKIDPHSKNCLSIAEILVLAIPPLMKVSGCVANNDPESNKLINFILKKYFCINVILIFF